MIDKGTPADYKIRYVLAIFERDKSSRNEVYLKKKVDRFAL